MFQCRSDVKIRVRSMCRACLIIVWLACALASGCGAGQSHPACASSASALREHAAPRQKYAVLINGDSERRHKDNVADAYETLQALGFAPDHIYVLSPRDRQFRFPSLTPRLSPVPTAFGHVMDQLGARISAGDLLLIYGTGHGDITDAGDGYLALRRGEIWPDELRARVEKCKGDSVIIMDQCFSGAFADGFEGTKSRVIVITTVDARHETDCFYFATTFWDAFLHPEKADRNHDGRTSVREAFDLAIRAHREGLKNDKELSAGGNFREFSGFADAVLN